MESYDSYEQIYKTKFPFSLNHSSAEQNHHHLHTSGSADVATILTQVRDIDKNISILGEKAVSFTGDVPQKRRKEIIDSFAGVKQYFVANKTCAGYGLNLQFCRNVVYYSNDWNLGTRLQSEDRVHRIGQDQIVNIYDIVAERTLDVRILDCLRRKESLMDALRREIDAHKDDKDKLMQWIKGVRDVGKGLH